MLQVPADFKPQFSGHETFPLRQLWLRKAYDAVTQAVEPASRSRFTDDEAIVRFGVGKNMVTSIRFWASACDVLQDLEGGVGATELAHFLFHPENGADRFLEKVASTWLMHWKVASTPDKTTTWWYLFNHVVQQTFERDVIAKELESMIAQYALRISAATLKRDVECCIRSYVPRFGGSNPEEISEPLLGELGLIQQSSRGSFELRRGAKRTLHDGVFGFALLEYWERLDTAGTNTGSSLSLDRVAHDYGSPGRVFKLDEDSVADRLLNLEALSSGLIQWTEQAGIRQVTRRDAALDDPRTVKYRLLRSAYAK